MRLLVDGADVAPLAEAQSSFQRMKGLLGRDSVEGALHLPDVSSVHTFFMKFAIDVAFLDRDLVVLHTRMMKPWRISGKRNHVKHVIEANAGSFEQWGLTAGSSLSFAVGHAQGQS